MIKPQQSLLNSSLGQKVYSKGFTLIELIMVIVLLGLLSAFALPKFADLSSNARIAKLEGLEGAMRSASSIVHSLALIEDKTDCGTDPTVDLNGSTITLRCGYPCPHPNGIANAVESAGFTWVGGNCGGRLGYIEVRDNDAPNPNTCKIRYSAARGNGRPPGITPTTSGC